MKNIAKIAVIGGGGRTGKYLVNQLLHQGFAVRLLLRNPENFAHNFPEENSPVEIVQGDVVDPKAVKEVLSGCSGVISTVGQRPGEPLVASAATANILNAMEKSADSLPTRRYILVAGLNVDTPFDKKGAETLAATEWMKTSFPEIHEDRQKAYQMLAKSETDWTLVRVPFIEFTDKRGNVAVSLEDNPGPKISAADIAGFLITQLHDRQFIKKAPFIANS
jgi:putative NADH-flavin reductase